MVFRRARPRGGVTSTRADLMNHSPGIRGVIAAVLMLLAIPACSDHERQISAVKEQAAADLAAAEVKAAAELSAARDLAAANGRAAALQLAEVKEQAMRDQAAAKRVATAVLASVREKAASKLAAAKEEAAREIAAAKLGADKTKAAQELAANNGPPLTPPRSAVLAQIHRAKEIGATYARFVSNGISDV